LNPGRGPYVKGVGRPLDIHMEVRIGSAQAPVSSGPPFRRDFRPLGSAQESVAELGGKQQMSGCGVGFQVRLPGNVFTKKVVIMVIKSGYIDKEFLALRRNLMNRKQA